MDLSLFAGFAALAARVGNAGYQPQASFAPPVDLPPAPPEEAPGPEPQDPLSARLFPRMSGKGGQISGALVAALLPPPAVGSAPSAFRGWLAGEVTDPLTPGLAIDVVSDAVVTEVMELESRIFLDAGAGLSAMGARKASDPALAAADAVWIENLPGAAVPLAERERAVRDFAAALAEVLVQYDPGAAGDLAALAAELRLSALLADLLARARGIEARWIAQGPPGGAAAQSLLGAPSPRANLRAPRLLARTAFLFLFSGKSVTTALRDALVELRFAQIVALAPDSWVLPDEVEAQIATAPVVTEDLEDLSRRLIVACLGGDAKADPVALFDTFEERAAIREQDGGQTRAEAERAAICELAQGLGLRAADLVRAWTLVPALYPRLSQVTFRVSPHRWGPKR